MGSNALHMHNNLFHSSTFLLCGENGEQEHDPWYLSISAACITREKKNHIYVSLKSGLCALNWADLISFFDYSSFGVLLWKDYLRSAEFLLSGSLCECYV